jgi:hypothetical protein
MSRPNAARRKAAADRPYWPSVAFITPGLYVLGLQHLRRRRSHFINGCAHDAEEIAQLVAEHLNYTLGKAA